ncbi:MAG TPA: tRNA (adenosine(37)-N6)-threonylcarbamoyltransferase complex ATPase subunit type 1 TsaE [bacterium]|nr:tRNA (adenosine(37)-N6)-threonylcarbamoyltransferase complex ATPase subunit type 1 TsaE [bacterium]HPQ67110.1 tRNA (adenosine(37)-N6)-threonylcarbamoyltransferase complex ATPase subunit type 1 TsaE [bacterium]
MRTEITAGPEETARLGEDLARRLGPGSVVALTGELGAGKTCLASGIARGLGVRERYLPSPTFVLAREYAGRLPLYHLDFYRLGKGADFRGLGLDEYLFGEGVTVIEWADRAPELIPPGAVAVELEYLDGCRRRIKIHESPRD